MEIVKIYGYIRISKDSLDMKNQRYQILEHSRQFYGKEVDEWFEDVVTGKAKATDRELGKLIDKMKKGNLLLIASTSRFGRNFFDVMLTGSKLYEKNAGLYAIQQNLDFSPKNPLAKLLMSVYAWMDESERETISTRTKIALARLKSEGVVLGRPKGTYSKKLEGKEKEILKLKEKGLSFEEIGLKFGASRQTVSAFLKDAA
jgi:DNA invertase Pin-like site-specific DNA recombinase